MNTVYNYCKNWIEGLNLIKDAHGLFRQNSVHFSSVAQSCLTLFDPMDCSMPGLPVHHQLPEFTQTHVHRAVMPSKHLILCHPLLLLPWTFPSMRVFSNESVLPIRWPEYWRFRFNISPSNEYLGVISFRMDCWRLVYVKSKTQRKCWV